jgi:hypothetical protein
MIRTDRASETTRPLTLDWLAGWLDAYGFAWEARDGDAAARLFSAHAAYHWGPFETPLEGRVAITQRWTAATSDQQDIRFEHTPLAITADYAFARWRTAFTRRGGDTRTQLDGGFVLRFDEHGMCSELREWWLERALAR